MIKWVVLFLLCIIVYWWIGYVQKYKITAYCFGHITKTGKQVKEGYCAVDPKVIPLGSIVFIEGLGIFRAEDTGSDIKGNWIDVYIKSKKKAVEFGVKHRKVVWILL
jgi:3D (Asp-Asp-Asp) domain-containing protein